MEAANLTGYNNLNLSRNMVRDFIELIPSGSMIVDQSGKILASNSEIDEILGGPNFSLEGLSVNDFVPTQSKRKHPSFIEFFFADPVKRQMGHGRDLFAVAASGKKVPVEIGLAPVNVDESCCVLVTLVDISSRVESLASLERSLQVSPNGTLVVDSAGKIMSVNETLCKMFGYGREKLLGSSIDSLLPERYRHHHKSLRDSYSKAAEVKIMGSGRDLTALHSDGSEFPVEVGLSPFNKSEGSILATLTDITQRKKMEQELRETNRNLEEFTYVASHDLRSPLRGISDLITWVKEDLGNALTGDVERNLDRMSIRVDRMEVLIESLLAYAKAGKKSHDIQIIDINSLLKEVIGLVDFPEAFTLNLNIVATSFKGVKTPLATVLRNLISNAIKHSDKKAGNIKISSMYEKNMILFSVEDNGPGIPESAISRIFDLFQTASSSSTSTGIGLSVSRRLVETHGGEISVENLNGGAIFRVWWPRYVRKDTHD